MRVRVTRDVEIPDPRKLERYRRTPELGPSILFFSGGTALRDTSRALIRYTHNSIHLITPFDSGGSSAILRQAFGMPAVGDIRNRLMALADQSVLGNPAIFDLFAHRLPKAATPTDLRRELDTLASGKHPLIRRVPDPMRKIIRNHFHQFVELMPEDFNLKGASLGNLVLTAGYLSNRRQMDPVIFLFSKLVQVCGLVRPTINKDLHLAVRLENGQVIVGQHQITGKESAPLASPIKDIWLTQSLNSVDPVQPAIRRKVAERILEADLICYPPGSFFSSVVANLLPDGVGKAVARNPCPKIFVPNTSVDPETPNMSVTARADMLRRSLVASGAPTGSDVLGHVLVDGTHGEYPGGLDPKELEKRGLTVIDAPLVTKESAPYIDAKCLSEILLSLC
ncbi:MULTISPECIES: GAK system CofD-like protein [unclassified Pseudodesulfovibrio]|uniref:GAK system CofD-like protein n=1 Tax=unclassified Pseudodesulfovibrio TaxID=2661612 RepID=UPI000FEBA2B0|nr:MULTISPECIES: GAK system CofD-like protein [unclassified Pseudodesulfovibrio]MCJ2164397.1 GAK system CofD-like protein [Pseudodesulfovibrio sp. S3-i]RWU04604.1 GAK system CofD-like protein [Pseudodesulfovibrio sp. S3]